MGIDFGAAFDGAGRAVGSAFDYAKQTGQEIADVFLKLAAEKPPREVALSGQYTLNLLNKDQDQSPLLIGSLDSVNKKFRFETKYIKPWGFRDVRVTQVLRGFDFDFKAKLDGYELPYLMHLIYLSLNGFDESYNAKTNASDGLLYTTPSFTILEKLEFDGAFVETRYNNVRVVEFSQSVPDDNGAIELDIKMFSPRSEIVSVKPNSTQIQKIITTNIEDAIRKAILDNSR